MLLVRRSPIQPMTVMFLISPSLYVPDIYLFSQWLIFPAIFLLSQWLLCARYISVQSMPAMLLIYSWSVNDCYVPDIFLFSQWLLCSCYIHVQSMTVRHWCLVGHINRSQQQNIFFSRMNRPSDDSSRKLIPVQFWSSWIHSNIFFWY